MANESFGDFYRGSNSSLTATNSQFRPLFNSTTALTGISSMVSASAQFASVITMVHRRLGNPTLTVELVPEIIAANLEQAVLHFSSIIEFFYIQSFAANILGLNRSYTEYDFLNQLPSGSNVLYNAFMANQYVNQGLYNANTEKRRGYIDVVANQQRYDIYSNGYDNDTGFSMDQYAASVSGYSVHFTSIYHSAGTYMNRLYDPFTNQQFLQAEFGFPSFPTDTVFYVLPLWQDIARGQLLSASDMVRKSAYKHEIYGRILELIPRPKESVRLWFDFYVEMTPGQSESPLQQSSYSGLSYLSSSSAPAAITSLATAPMKELTYETLNTASRQWVHEYTLALCMDTLAWIRGRYPWTLPDGTQITLDADALRAESSAMKEKLEAELKEHLLAMDSYTLISKERTKSDDNIAILKNNSPMPIWRTRV